MINSILTFLRMKFSNSTLVFVQLLTALFFVLFSGYALADEDEAWKKAIGELGELNQTSEANTLVDMSPSGIYEGTMQDIEQARTKRGSARQLSEIALIGAGIARDNDFHTEAKKLFEQALIEDPDNPKAHRLYGDFLMGYRGFQGLSGAATQAYQKALELLTDDPDSDPGELQRLNRSMDILTRDAKDGMIIFRNDDLQVSLTLEAEYARETPDSVTFIEQQRQVERFRDRLASNGSPFATDWNGITDNTPERLARRLETDTFSASMLVRFTNELLPTIRFEGERKEVKDGGQIADFPGPRFTDLINRRWELALAKDGILLPFDIDWDSEAGIEWSSITGDDQYGSYERSKEDTTSFNFNTGLSKNLNNQVVKLYFESRFLDINNDTSSDDTGNSQTLYLRYSDFYGALDDGGEGYANERFRGRRSGHVEVGIRRVERVYKGHTDGRTQAQINETPALLTGQKQYYPYITLERLGLMKGQLDLTLNYRYIDNKLKVKDFSTNVSNIERYDVHEITFQPSWVPVYNLYEDDFITGLEHLLVNAPLKYIIDEGDYTRANIGVNVRPRWVFANFGMDVIFGLDYNYYTDLDTADWGGSVRFTLNSGVYDRLKGWKTW